MCGGSLGMGWVGEGKWGNPCSLETETAWTSVRKHGCCLNEEESVLSVCVCIGCGSGVCSLWGKQRSGWGIPSPCLSPYLEWYLGDTLNQPTQRRRHQLGLCQTQLNLVKCIHMCICACVYLHICAQRCYAPDTVQRKTKKSMIIWRWCCFFKLKKIHKRLNAKTSA